MEAPEYLGGFHLCSAMARLRVAFAALGMDDGPISCPRDDLQSDHQHTKVEGPLEQAVVLAPMCSFLSCVHRGTLFVLLDFCLPWVCDLLEMI